jgi:hypothetical protein
VSRRESASSSLTAASRRRASSPWRATPPWIPRLTCFSESRAVPRAARRDPRGTVRLTGSSMAAAHVFADTADFLALWDAGDEHHAAADFSRSCIQ